MVALKHIFRNKTAAVVGNNPVHLDSLVDGSSYKCVPKLLLYFRDYFSLSGVSHDLFCPLNYF